MVSKTIKYTDYNGMEREETYWFNLSESELTMMEASPDGGSLSSYLEALAKSPNPFEVMEIYKKIIKASYGVKSADGRRFMKKKDGKDLFEEFVDTPAFDKLFIDLLKEPDKMAEFINNIVAVKPNA